MILIYALLLLLNLIYMPGQNWRMMLCTWWVPTLLYKSSWPATNDTLARWIKMVMHQSGVNLNTFSAHSCRSASTSKATTAGVPLEKILKAGQWSTSSTFYVVYCKDIMNTEHLVDQEFAGGLIQPPPAPWVTHVVTGIFILLYFYTLVMFEFFLMIIVEVLYMCLGIKVAKHCVLNCCIVFYMLVLL